MQPESTLRKEIESLRASIDQLYALNELARLVGASDNVESTIQVLTRRTIALLKAEQGVITLQEGAGDSDIKTLFRTRMAGSDKSIYRPHDVMVGWMQIHKRPLLINNPQDTDLIKGIAWDPSIRSVLCVPLILKNELIGVFTVYNKQDPNGFTKDDEKLLYIIASQSTQIIHNKRLVEERNRVKLIFGQHVSQAVVDDLLQEGAEIRSRRLTACIMFLDIRGFTTYAEKHSPEEVVDYLNRVFDFMIVCVQEHKGIVHRLLGDSFVALFGAPVSHGNDCQHAVDASLEIIRRLEAKCAAGDLEPTRVGIGLHVGPIVVGTVGSKDRKEFQINGDVVNTTARIEQLNKKYESQLLISEEVFNKIDGSNVNAERIDGVEIRGRQKQHVLYKLA